MLGIKIKIIILIMPLSLLLFSCGDDSKIEIAINKGANEVVDTKLVLDKNVSNIGYSLTYPRVITNQFFSNTDIDKYYFNAIATNTYVVKVKMNNCQLTVNATNDKKEAISYEDKIVDVIIDDIANVSNSMSFTIKPFNINNCIYEKPMVIAQNTQQTQAKVNLSGQAIATAAQPYSLDVTKVNSVIYLRNTKIRKNNSSLVIEVNKTLVDNIKNETIKSIANITSNEINSLDKVNKAAIDAYANATITYNFFKNVLQLNSYDDNNASMIINVNIPIPSRATYTCNKLYNKGSLYNAYWNGKSINYSTPQIDRSFSLAASLGISAHEWAHAITSSFANLVYSKESGALNEAFSDWLGVAVLDSIGKNEWLISLGKRNQENNWILRSLKNPTLYKQPDIYRGEFWQDVSEACTPSTCNDQCGVHTNSGVANKMFYLLVNGGTHNNIIVTGIGMQAAIKIALAAMRNYWTAATDFHNAKLGMIAAAISYDNTHTTNTKEQVEKAWNAVMVVD